VSGGFSTRSKERVCSIADEAIVPNISSSKHPGESGDVVDNRFNWAFSVYSLKTLALVSTVGEFTAIPQLGDRQTIGI
jgi:hypothetical protein